MIASPLPARPIAEYLLALADARRLRIVFALRDGERSAPALAAEIRATRDCVTRHLVHLRRAGLVACRRERRLILYRLTSPDVFAICSGVCAALDDGRSSTPRGGKPTAHT